jgi:hypothetical protein
MSFKFFEKGGPQNILFERRPNPFEPHVRMISDHQPCKEENPS